VAGIELAIFRPMRSVGSDHDRKSRGDPVVGAIYLKLRGKIEMTLFLKGSWRFLLMKQLKEIAEVFFGCWPNRRICGEK
jgi:hypothetical protein